MKEVSSYFAMVIGDNIYQLDQYVNKGEAEMASMVVSKVLKTDVEVVNVSVLKRFYGSKSEDTPTT